MHSPRSPPTAMLTLIALGCSWAGAKKSARLVMSHAQRADHPILIAIPETGYLKGFTVEVIASR